MCVDCSIAFRSTQVKLVTDLKTDLKDNTDTLNKVIIKILTLVKMLSLYGVKFIHLTNPMHRQ